MGQIIDLHKCFCKRRRVSPSEWYGSNVLLTGNSVNGRKEIPIDDVLSRESKILTEIGFSSINDFLGYTARRDFIFPN